MNRSNVETECDRETKIREKRDRQRHMKNR
jgi:hypothetical protein